MLAELLQPKGFFSIPFRRAKTGHVMLSISIENQPFRFILDTGATTTVLDIGVARQNNFTAETIGENAGGLGTTSMTVYKTAPVEIRIGDLIITEHVIFCLDLSHVTKALLSKGVEEAVHGVIGADILVKHNAIIDYGSNTLFLGAAV